jgi:hypothetical protein
MSEPLIQLTLFEGRKPLTKTLAYKNGKLNSGPYITAGSGYSRRLSTTLRQLAEQFSEFPKTTCLIHGVAERDAEVRVHDYRREGQISRTLEFYSYPDGPASLMLDHDYDPEKGGRPYTPAELIAALSEVDPHLGAAAHIVKLSTSAEVYTADGEKVSPNAPSYHLYFAVKNGKDIKRYGKLLFAKLYLAGHGFSCLSKDGSILKRGPIDESVFSPERCDFVSGAVLRKGLEQRLGKAEYIEGNHLVDTSLLADLTAAEKKKLHELQQAHREELKPLQEPRRRSYAADKAKRTGQNAEELYQALVDAEHGKVDASLEVVTKDGRRTTLQALYDNDEHRTYIQNPFGDSAQPLFLIHGADATLKTFNHGGRTLSVQNLDIWGDEPDSEPAPEYPAMYPAPTGSLRAAEMQIKMAMDTFVSHVNTCGQYDALKDEYGDVPVDDDMDFFTARHPQYKSDFDLYLMNDIFGDMHEPAEASWSAHDAFTENLTTKRDTLLICPTGSGKSHQARDAAIQLVGDHPGDAVGFAGKTHLLNAENEKKLRDEFRGASVAVFRGRQAENPRNPDEQMCIMAAEAGEISAAGGDVLQLLCRNKAKGTQCPYFSDCAYLAQHKQEADIWIYAQTMMTNQKPKCMGNLVAQFVDENPQDTFLAGTDARPSISVAELMEIERLAKKRIDEPVDVDKISDKKRNSLLQGTFETDLETAVRDERKDQWRRIKDMNDTLVELPDGEIEREELSWPIDPQTKTGVWACQHELNIHPGMSKKERTERTIAAAKVNKPIRNMSRLIEIMAGDDFSEIVPGVRKVGDTFHMSWKKKRTQGFDVPTMFMDATARAETYKALFPSINDVIKIDCDTPYTTVRQITNWNGAMKKLVVFGNDPEHDNTARKNTSRVAHIAEVRAAQFRNKGKAIDGKQVDVLVVTYKSTCEAMHVLQSEGRIPDNVEFIHYGGLAGLDRWKDVACLIMAGWAAKGVQAVESVAELLKGDRLDPITEPKHPGWYSAKEVGGLAKGKDHGPALEHVYHPDPLAEAVRWEMMEGELLQAIGRGRATRRGPENPLQIDILTNIPLPIETDEFLSWKKAQPAYTDLLAARGINIDAPQSTKGYWNTVKAVLSDVFPSAVAAKQAGYRSREQTPIDISLYANVTVSTWGKAKVRVGRYAVPVRFRDEADLLRFGPEAQIEVIEHPRPILVLHPPVSGMFGLKLCAANTNTVIRSAVDILLGGSDGQRLLVA